MKQQTFRDDDMKSVCQYQETLGNFPSTHPSALELHQLEIAYAAKENLESRCSGGALKYKIHSI